MKYTFTASITIDLDEAPDAETLAMLNQFLHKFMLDKLKLEYPRRACAVLGQNIEYTFVEPLTVIVTTNPLPVPSQNS